MTKKEELEKELQTLLDTYEEVCESLEQTNQRAFQLEQDIAWVKKEIKNQ